QMEGTYEIHTDSAQNIYVLSSVGLFDIDVDGNDKGDNYDNSTSKMDFILASFTCEGDYRWSKIIGGGGKERPPHIVIDEEDNVFVTGQFRKCHNTNYPPRIENDTILDDFTQSQCKTLFMAKFSSEGEMLWFNMPQELGDQTDVLTNTISMDLRVDNEGYMYWFLALPAGNHSYENGAFVSEDFANEGKNRFHIFKYNPQGEFVQAITPNIEVSTNTAWGKGFNFHINPHNNHFYFYIYRVKPETQTVIFGGQQVEHAFVIASFDQEGNFLWMGEDNTTEWSPNVYDLAFDADNNIYLGGKYSSHGDLLGFTSEEGLTPNFIMKTDPTFENLIWASYSHGNEDSQISTGTAFEDGALLINDDELVFTGASGGTGFTWAGKTIDITEQIAGFNTLFARFDTETGDAIELNSMESSLHYDEVGTALAIDAAGDYLVGGQFEYDLFDDHGNVVYNVGGQTDFFLTKYATQACNEPDMAVAVEIHQENPFQVYPNPVQNQLYITNLQTKTTFSLYALNGRLISHGQLHPNQNSIPTASLNNGLYFLKLKDEKGREAVIKVVKE
ncbi:MAG TPA: T9SS type A sorting domain-containing protein, partial [Flavobacteriaceae bacterium]|nr:T9SS type A sorting domain-containing protein [Flavobacteriaceae bacterium]